MLTNLKHQGAVFSQIETLESRMVLSVETTLQHPRRGFIKLEDTVAVTETGHEVYGDRAHGWNRAAAKVSRW
jgi:Xaa-Pro aminopeptidase